MAGTPTPTAVAVSATQIDISWPAIDSATGYDIERDSVVIATDHATTTYNDTGLNPSTTYTYRVRSVGPPPSGGFGTAAFGTSGFGE